MISITDHVFYPLDRNLDNRLLNRLRHSELEFIHELSNLSEKYNMISEIEGDKMIWKDGENNQHLIFHLNIKAFDINKLIEVYREAKQNSNIQNFIFIDQAHTFKQAYDIFRLNQLSYMQHCNHFRIKKIRHKAQELKLTGESLYTLFSRLKPHQKYRWGKCFVN